MLKIVATVVIAGGLVIGTLFIGVFTTAPHMKSQPHLRSYQFQMELPPSGTVPVDTGRAAQGGRRGAQQGAIYYGYYCQFCHGRSGAGDGPVGFSYIPTPADLRSERVQRKSDNDLVEAMVNGVGHHPVLGRVTQREQLISIADYLRTLDSGN